MLTRIIPSKDTSTFRICSPSACTDLTVRLISLGLTRHPPVLNWLSDSRDRLGYPHQNTMPPPNRNYAPKSRCIQATLFPKSWAIAEQLPASFSSGRYQKGFGALQLTIRQQVPTAPPIITDKTVADFTRARHAGAGPG